MDEYDQIVKVKKLLRLTNNDLGTLVGRTGDTFRKAMNRKNLSDYEIKVLAKSLAGMEMHETEDERQEVEKLLKMIRTKIQKNKSLILDKILTEEEEKKLKDQIKGDPAYTDLYQKTAIGEKEGVSALSQINVNEPREIFETKNGSQYEELGNGKYVLTVPLVPFRAQARYLDDFTDAEFIHGLSKVSFIVDRVGVGVYRGFEIQNDSMDDDSKRSIPAGSFVCGRELHRNHWKDPLRIKQYSDWIIVHRDTILCKQIIHHDVENGIITCHSLNESPEYQDFKINLNEVNQLFNIIAVQSMRT